MKTLMALTFLISVAAWAHDGHVHEPALEAPPHGGLLRDAGPFKSEVVLTGDLAKIYIYDKKLKLIPAEKNELKGELQFPRDKKPRPVTFKRNGDIYEAKLTGIAKVHRFDLHVQLEIGGQKGLADFGIDNVQ